MEISDFSKISEELDSIRYINNLNDKTLFIYSSTSLKKVKINNKSIEMENWHNIGKNINELEIYINEHNKIKQVVTFGGGSAIDIGKYISYKLNIKLTCIITMLSTNAYATDKVALICNGTKTTIKAKMPDKIIVDNELLKLSKMENAYGLADVLSIYTALYDWKISSKYNNEEIDESIYNRANRLLDRTMNFIENNSLEEIINNNVESFNIIGEAGYITNLYGNGRPESGSEHIMAKEIEKNIDVPHGMSVSVGILTMGMMQKRNIEKIEKIIKKLNILNKNNMEKYGLVKEIIEKSLINLKPRADRYTIVNIYDKDTKLKKYILNKIFEILDRM